MNSHGEIYETKYGLTTSQRLYGTVTENREGRGPCYLKTDEISAAQEQDLYRALPQHGTKPDTQMVRRFERTGK